MKGGRGLRSECKRGSGIWLRERECRREKRARKLIWVVRRVIMYIGTELYLVLIKQKITL